MAENATTNRPPQHAYATLPDSSFWRRSIAGQDPFGVDPVADVPFTIGKADKVATAGSCFAQHISRTLAADGFNYFVTESGPAEQQYGVFPARFGNIYTTRQLLQLFQRAYGLRVPADGVWTTDAGRYVDPFRPQIQSFETVESLEQDRARHLSAVRRMFEQCDVFIFTLGLTEMWQSSVDGSALPLAPGVAGHPADASQYSFHNLSVEEISSDLQAFIGKLRTVNPGVRVILTVSPVPLVATFVNRHVLVSTIYSKSVLRVAAEQVVQAMPNTAYFPAYEIVTGHHFGYSLFEPDLRSIKPSGVAHVMSIFARHYLNATATPKKEVTAPRPARPVVKDKEFEELAKVICEEEMLDR
jgi:hypothetical protein